MIDPPEDVSVATLSNDAIDSIAMVQRLELHVIDGPDRGLEVSSKGERLVVGTRSSADVVLRDPTVSRYHCSLRLRDDRVEVEDLDSRNGTNVDGIRVSLGWFDKDATLALGQTRIRCRLSPDRVAVPLSTKERFGDLVGRSRAMRAMFAILERAAPTETTILLQGETGTGKDVAALSIHAESGRRGAFVIVDCGSIPPNLIESHLFGHVRGAFTGATHDRAGVFELAAGGTLFLDEIGELPLELQPKLLRALESRRIRRVGGDGELATDVRIIAATNRDLRREVNARRFREDLYYRLSVLEITVPALRHRIEDMALLVDTLLESHRATPTAHRLRAPAAIDAAMRHVWPGNVRELRNYVERSLAIDEPAPLELDATSLASAPDVDPTRPYAAERERWLRSFERRYLERVLEEAGGNVSRAARTAGINRVYFYKLMARSGMAVPSKREP
jgi:two-component system, NtrC family, response regulator GlrR